jgi:hypothetical protein
MWQVGKPASLPHLREAVGVRLHMRGDKQSDGVRIVGSPSIGKRLSERQRHAVPLPIIGDGLISIGGLGASGIGAAATTVPAPLGRSDQARARAPRRGRQREGKIFVVTERGDGGDVLFTVAFPRKSGGSGSVGDAIPGSSAGDVADHLVKGGDTGRQERLYRGRKRWPLPAGAPAVWKKAAASCRGE